MSAKLIEDMLDYTHDQHYSSLRLINLNVLVTKYHRHPHITNSSSTHAYQQHGKSQGTRTMEEATTLFI